MSEQHVIVPIGLPMCALTDPDGGSDGGLVAVAGNECRLDAREWAIWLLAHGAWSHDAGGWTRRDVVLAGEADGLGDIDAAIGQLEDRRLIASFDPRTASGLRAAERLRAAALLSAFGELSDGDERTALLGVLGTPRRVSITHPAFVFWKTAPLATNLRVALDQAVHGGQYDDAIAFMTDADLFAELCTIAQTLISRGALYLDLATGDW